MGFLDDLKRKFTSEVNRVANNTVNSAVNKAVTGIGKGTNRDVKFTFAKVPTTLDELKALPEASLDTAFKTTALALIVMCNYKNDREKTYEMLDWLKGPDDTSVREKQLMDEKLGGDLIYKAFSFFNGATPENDYKPTEPYTCIVSENPYSFDNENWATIYVHSGGADNPRTIKLRKKPSTGQWFINEIQCLGDIRIPKSTDKWA